VTRAASYVYVIVGAPGTGKSSQIRILLEDRSARRLIFDPLHEYDGLGDRLDLEAIRRRLVEAGRGPFSLLYQPDGSDLVRLKRQFDVFCKLAFAAGDLLCVVDEAADVTSPVRSQVPEGWSTLLRQGRHRAVRIIAATQRPADVDKRLWTFATRLRTGRLNYSSDRKEIANVLSVEVAELAGLTGQQWIERDMLTGALARGVLDWKRGRPVNVAR